MVMIPMKHEGGGTVKYAVESFISNVNKTITFPSDRRIINAVKEGSSASERYPFLIQPNTTNDQTHFVFNGTNYSELAANTAYSIQYTYILNTD